MSYQVPAVMLLPADPEEISAALEGLVARDLRFLRKHPSTPHPYQLGLAGRIRYHFEMPGAHWWSIGEVLRAGWGDCKDVASWVVALARLAGVPARVLVVTPDPVRRPGVMHALVEYGCGCREDPSIALGMPVPQGGAPWMTPTR